MFRVKAANAVGLSENSQESEAVTVQAALSKCDSCATQLLVSQMSDIFSAIISFGLICYNNIPCSRHAHLFNDVYSLACGYSRENTLFYKKSYL